MSLDNPYAPPAASPDAPRDRGEGPWRQRNLLLVNVGPDKAADALPQACVRCGREADGPAETWTLVWYPRWVYLMLLINVLVFALTAWFTRREVRITAPLCFSHANSLRTRRMAGIIVMVFSGVVFFGGLSLAMVADMDEALLAAPVGMLGGLVGLVLYLTGRNFLRPVKVDKEMATLAGAHVAFLDRLPEA